MCVGGVDGCDSVCACVGVHMCESVVCRDGCTINVHRCNF